MAMIKVCGTFDGNSIRKDGICVMKFRFPASEMAKSVSLLTLIGRPLKAAIKNEEEKKSLGVCVFKSLSFDKEGEAKFQIETDVQNLKDFNPGEVIEKVIYLMIKEAETDQNGEVEDDK